MQQLGKSIKNNLNNKDNNNDPIKDNNKIQNNSCYSNIDRYQNEINKINCNKLSFFPQQVLDKVLKEKNYNKNNNFIDNKNINYIYHNITDTSETLYMNKTEIGFISKHLKCNEKCCKYNKRNELEGLNESQIIDRVKYDPYLIHRVMSKQQFPT